MTHQTFKSFFNAKSTTEAFKSAKNIDPSKRPKLKKPNKKITQPEHEPSRLTKSIESLDKF